MKKRALFSSIMTIALCLCLIAGSTFAIFTDEATVDIAATSAGVELRAFIRNDSVKTYWCGNETARAGVFRNGGTAKISGESLILKNMLPGDKAAVTIDILNESNVSIAYRVVMSVEGKLAEVLVATASGDAIGSELTMKDNKSEWITVLPTTVSGREIPTVTLAVEMPTWVTNDYVNATGMVTITVQAIQQPGAGVVFYNDLPYASVEAALEAAVPGEVAELAVSGSVQWNISGNEILTQASAVVFSGLAFAELSVNGLGVLGETALPITYRDLTVVDRNTSYQSGEWDAAMAAFRANATFHHVTYVGNGVTEALES